MAQRIRYKDYKDDTVISNKTFVSASTGARYRVVLDYKEMQYKIRNERTKEFVVKSKNYGNMNVLKRTAREHLSKLGVRMESESRDRSFGLCPKGYSQKKHEVNIIKKRMEKDLP